MNVKQWAERLNGREYCEEMTGDEEKQAESDGVVIVFGQSDDLIEFRGVIDCEGGALGGALYRISSLKEAIREYHGKNPCLTLTDAQWKALPEIRAIWSPTSGGMPSWASWEMQSAIPHETFDIMEDGELYCRGIVFAWADAFPKKDAIDEMIADGREILARQEADDEGYESVSDLVSDIRSYIVRSYDGETDEVVFSKTDEAAEGAIKAYAEAARRNEEVNDFRMDELDAVMTSVDKWLEGDDLKNNPATRAADAREIALKAIEAETRRADMAEASLKIVADVAVAWVNRNLCDEHMPIMCKALEEDGLRAAIMGVKA